LLGAVFSPWQCSSGSVVAEEIKPGKRRQGPRPGGLTGVADGLQTREETAAQLGVAVRTICRWEQDDGLPVISIGKLRLHDPAAIRAWIAARASKPG